MPSNADELIDKADAILKGKEIRMAALKESHEQHKAGTVYREYNDAYSELISAEVAVAALLSSHGVIALQTLYWDRLQMTNMALKNKLNTVKCKAFHLNQSYGPHIDEVDAAVRGNAFKVDEPFAWLIKYRANAREKTG